MSWVFRLVIAIMVGAATFTLVQHLFRLQSWMLLTIAVGTGIVAFIGQAAEFFKKLLEPIKLSHEISKLRREAEKDKRTVQEESRLVKPATAEEIKKYGTSYIEREIDRRFLREEEPDRLKPRPFISTSREDK